MSSIQVEDTKIQGCFQLFPSRASDNRGVFVKTFHQEVFAKAHLRTSFVEDFHSISRRGVIRGLHFQTPPHAHVKLVYCVSGEIIDAIVDIRRGSPTFGVYAHFILSERDANMIYVAEGVAHGFEVLSETATVLYKTTSLYSPNHDKGIRWDSAGIPWTTSDPLLSVRDKSFPVLSEYQSPFEYSPTAFGA